MHMAIDVIEAYGCRVIEGLDADEITAEDTSILEFAENTKRDILHKPSGKRITLGCASKYFEPTQSYYRFNDRSSCDYVRKGLNAVSCLDCKDCIEKCITSRLKIKPKKIIIAANYFE
jgi:hypothetical protein